MPPDEVTFLQTSSMRGQLSIIYAPLYLRINLLSLKKDDMPINLHTLISDKTFLSLFYLVNSP
jgi:hypothetical protein